MNWHNSRNSGPRPNAQELLLSCEFPKPTETRLVESSQKSHLPALLESGSIRGLPIGGESR